MEIHDKVVIITGASGGIGLETARLLSKNGARVALAARSTDKLKAISETLPGSFVVTADMSRESDARSMVKSVHDHYGRIDVLINNAGRGMWNSAESTDLDQYRGMMELNLFGPLAAMQAVIPFMRRQGGGVIINISSGVSRMFIPGLSAYASTKYALNAISLTARAELAPDNIRVGIMLPGMTATDFGRNALGSRPAAMGGPGARGSGPAGPAAPRADMPPVETAEMVAEKILEAIRTESAEVLANSMQRR
ncbi:MAG TPA: SDR family NAD(P)-dependent oxidoreductase [Spirochaetia bacterium]|nr:SDR family NAD(P)-dependent oxidoreductase [Spirochaetia bacterium]